MAFTERAVGAGSIPLTTLSNFQPWKNPKPRRKDNSNYGTLLMKPCRRESAGDMVFVWKELPPKILESCAARLVVHTVDEFWANMTPTIDE
jgi:hypothetical protein